MHVAQDYWSKLTSHRLDRRRALSLAVGTAAAAFIAACGSSGGGSGSTPSGNKASLVVQPIDTTKQAKRGGIIKDRTFGDAPSLDILTPATTHNSVGPHVYSSLFQFKPGVLKPSENEIAGDVAESWEWAPDGLSVNLKLRQGMKFHNKAPVSG